jgi:hypothetical protein
VLFHLQRKWLSILVSHCHISTYVLSADYLVYDYLPPAELAAETILCIFDNIVISKMRTSKFPPADHDHQRGWYKDVLRDTLTIAKRTRYIPRTYQAETEHDSFSEAGYDNNYLSGSEGDILTDTKPPLEGANLHLPGLLMAEPTLSSNLDHDYYQEHSQQLNAIPQLSGVGSNPVFNGMDPMVGTWSVPPSYELETQGYNDQQNNFAVPQGFDHTPGYVAQQTFDETHLWPDPSTVDPENMSLMRRD